MVNPNRVTTLTSTGKEGATNLKPQRRVSKNPRKSLSDALNLRKCTKTVNEICDTIDLLCKLISAAMGHEQSREIDNTAKWIKIRDHAQRLFSTLNSRWSQICPDKHSHRASLLVDPQSGCQIDGRFVFVLSLDAEAAPTLPPWNWRDVEIEPVDAL